MRSFRMSGDGCCGLINASAEVIYRGELYACLR